MTTIFFHSGSNVIMLLSWKHLSMLTKIGTIDFHRIFLNPLLHQPNHSSWTKTDCNHLMQGSNFKVDAYWRVTIDLCGLTLYRWNTIIHLLTKAGYFCVNAFIKRTLAGTRQIRFKSLDEREQLLVDAYLSIAANT